MHLLWDLLVSRVRRRRIFRRDFRCPTATICQRGCPISSTASARLWSALRREPQEAPPDHSALAGARNPQPQGRVAAGRSRRRDQPRSADGVAADFPCRAAGMGDAHPLRHQQSRSVDPDHEKRKRHGRADHSAHGRGRDRGVRRDCHAPSWRHCGPSCGGCTTISPVINMPATAERRRRRAAPKSVELSPSSHRDGDDRRRQRQITRRHLR